MRNKFYISLCLIGLFVYLPVLAVAQNTIDDVVNGLVTQQQSVDTGVTDENAAAEDTAGEDAPDVNLQQKVEEALGEEIEEPLPPPMTDKPAVRLRWLNKVTARNKTVDIRVGDVVKIGNLYMKAQTCREASPLETPESAAFLQIWEGGADDVDPQWVFSGWMFASSPGLSAMDHPIYDVWVLSCVDDVSADTQDDVEAVETNDAVNKDNVDVQQAEQPDDVIKGEDSE